jgi:7-cyano-7-deazaguanine synthase in queuosine biosynthesis
MNNENNNKSPLILYPLMRYEDPILLRRIEDILIKQRGWVFRMPPPGSSVMLSISGGLDTTISAAILMEEWGLKVWPFFIRRGQRSEAQEEESVKFFTEWFSKRYSGLFQPVQFMTAPNPPLEIKAPIAGMTYPMRDTAFFSFGIQYAISLEKQGKETIRTIFCGYTIEEAALHPRNTLTTLRSFTLHACIANNDFRWQITALPLERSIGYYFGKRELIQWAFQHNIPIEKTRSCVESTQIHCGECWFCTQRKRRFLAAGVPDKTEYLV